MTCCRLSPLRLRFPFAISARFNWTHPSSRMGNVIMGETSPDRIVSIDPPAILEPFGKHNATVIFLHGLGDQGYGWSSRLDELRSAKSQRHIKFICPHASSMPVFVNLGQVYPAWFNIFGLPGSREDTAGIEGAMRYIHSVIDEEIRNGVQSQRILVGGFSMGGALAIYSGLTYPKKLGGIFSLSGYLLQGNTLPGDHVANLDTPVWLAHGDHDGIVDLRHGKLAEAAIKLFNPNVTLHVYPVAHLASDQELRDLAAFIGERLPKMH